MSEKSLLVKNSLHPSLILILANTRANDTVAETIIKCMEENKTIEKLNVESNFISAKPMQELVHQSCQSNSLTELRIDNQRNK